MKREPEGPGFSRVSILGLGVMGGSLARALALLPHGPTRIGWSPDAVEGARAREDGALTHAAATVEEAVEEADLVVLAAPLPACVALVPRALAAMPPGAIVTDVASLKAPLEAAVERAGGRDRWVGSHPMCGSAESGYGASRADLYRGARVWLVAPAEARAALHRVSVFWRSVGALPEVTHSGEHDGLMALTSHLPQLTANALARVLADAGVSPSALGPGGSDMTRLAASAPEVWEGILAHAAPELGEALRALAQGLEELASLTDARDTAALARFMEATRTWKNSL